MRHAPLAPVRRAADLTRGDGRRRSARLHVPGPRGCDVPRRGRVLVPLHAAAGHVPDRVLDLAGREGAVDRQDQRRVERVRAGAHRAEEAQARRREGHDARPDQGRLERPGRAAGEPGRLQAGRAGEGVQRAQVPPPRDRRQGGGHREDGRRGWPPGGGGPDPRGRPRRDVERRVHRSRGRRAGLHPLPGCRDHALRPPHADRDDQGRHARARRVRRAVRF